MAERGRMAGNRLATEARSGSEATGAGAGAARTLEVLTFSPLPQHVVSQQSSQSQQYPLQQNRSRKPHHRSRRGLRRGWQQLVSHAASQPTFSQAGPAQQGAQVFTGTQALQAGAQGAHWQPQSSPQPRQSTRFNSPMPNVGLDNTTLTKSDPIRVFSLMGDNSFSQGSD